jgi:F-type H+-transporting ATPase subunit b
MVEEKEMAFGHIKTVATGALFSLFGGAAALAAGGEGGGGLPQLDTTTFASQIFWLAISFVVLYWIMSKIAAPRIAEVLEERHKRIADDIDTAERLRDEAETVRGEYEKAVADARSKARDLVRETQEDLAAAQSKADAEGLAKAAEQTKAAEARIGEQTSQALESLKAVASETAVAAAEKLTGMKATEAQVEKALSTAGGGA